MPAKKSEKNNALSFEQAMKRLDEITTMLENGNATLDDSLSLFEEGIGLVKHCNGVLNEAQAKIKTLTESEIDS